MKIPWRDQVIRTIAVTIDSKWQEAFGMRPGNGFTLVELLVTLGIVAIVLTIGVPNFRSIIMDNRLASQANQFVTSVSMTRSVAVRYQRNATVCASANFDDPVPDCTVSTDWSNGWIVWVDRDRDAVTDANEIVSVFGPLNGASTLDSLAVSSFTYDARGFSLAGGDDLSLCDNRAGETGRLIRINATGRTNVSRQECP
jgi:type IV fimbrial biogenesis protein FimT